MRPEPRSTRRVIQQLTMTGRQIVALAGKKHAQNSVTLLTQREAHRVGMALGRQPAAGSRVPQIASRLQFLVIGTSALVPGSSAHALPSGTQRKPLWKWPVRIQSLFWHEEGTGHKSSRNGKSQTPIVTAISMLCLKRSAWVLVGDFSGKQRLNLLPS
jgi:hypothetical protein